MNYSVLLSPGAENDVLQIKWYLKNIFCSNQAVANFENAFYKALDNIGFSPYAFPITVIDGIIYRKIAVKNYITIYRIDEQNKAVQVIAVGHSRRKRKNLIKR